MEKEKYLQAVYENEKNWLINDTEKIIQKMNLTIFFNRFRAILFDLRRELIWSFKCMFN